MGEAFKEAPELNAIQTLFKKAYLGLSFTGNTKTKVAEKLKTIQSMGKFQQLLCLLEIFQILALSDEIVALNDRDTSVKLFLNDKIRMGAIYEYIRANYDETPDVNKVAASVHLSTAAFCRYFKKQTKITFTDFVNQYRITQAKTLLLQNKTISETCYEVGFQSLSYFNKLFRKIAGENPSAFKKHYLK